MKKIAFGIAIAFAASVAGGGPASATSCNLGPYIVFFAKDHAYLDASQRGTLDEFLGHIGNCGYAQTLLASHSDGSEDEAVADRRLASVTAYLTAHGIPADDIEGKAFGSSRPRVPGPPDSEEPQNRRVEITFARFETESAVR